MYGKSAFGNPDGSRTEITDMMSEFIIFDKKYFSSGVASPDDLKTRVIVGAKGSGKTVYLRRMQANLKSNLSVYVNSIEQELPSTDLVVKFGQSFPEPEITEKWMYVWKLAILRSVISNILLNDEWNQEVTEADKELLLKYENKVFPKYNVPMGIYAEARNILLHYCTRNSFNGFAMRSEWDELEVIVGKILKTLPPIYFFVDSVDEEYAHAPMYWLRCQKGLFYRVMRLIREEVYGNKLHVVISIRDNVMASVCESEHRTRYVNNEEHVKILKWSYKTIKYFFEGKIANLKDCYFINEGYEKTIDNWLGINTLHNNYRNIDEPIIQYILRHTRLLPRDIVIVGNSLAQIKRIMIDSPDIDINVLIRQKISECAKTFGSELLQICANQIINNEMPKGAANREYSEVYTSIKEYKDSVSHLLKQVLLQANSDRLSWDQVKVLEDKARSVISENCKMFDVLWQNGGIGYIEEGPNGEREVFFNQEYPEFLLPKNKEEYVLRSCLIDAVGIVNKQWGAKPVIGGNLLE